jgi:hypothetical protein
MALIAVLCLPCHDAVTTPIPADPAISPLTDTRFRPSAGGLGPQLTVASDNGQWLRGRRSKRGEDRRSTRRDTDSWRQSTQKHHNRPPEAPFTLMVPLS